jgi:hypothetical protein
VPGRLRGGEVDALADRVRDTRARDDDRTVVGHVDGVGAEGQVTDAVTTGRLEGRGRLADDRARLLGIDASGGRVLAERDAADRRADDERGAVLLVDLVDGLESVVVDQGGAARGVHGLVRCDPGPVESQDLDRAVEHGVVRREARGSGRDLGQGMTDRVPARDERTGCEARVCVQDVPSRSVGGRRQVVASLVALRPSAVSAHRLCFRSVPAVVLAALR